MNFTKLKELNSKYRIQDTINKYYLLNNNTHILPAHTFIDSLHLIILYRIQSIQCRLMHIVSCIIILKILGLKIKNYKLS